MHLAFIYLRTGCSPTVFNCIYVFMCIHIITLFIHGMTGTVPDHEESLRRLKLNLFNILACCTFNKTPFDTQNQNSSVQISACMPVDFTYDLPYLSGQCCLHSYRPLSGSHWMPTIYAELPPGGRQYFHGHC